MQLLIVLDHLTRIETLLIEQVEALVLNLLTPEVQEAVKLIVGQIEAALELIEVQLLQEPIHQELLPVQDLQELLPDRHLIVGELTEVQALAPLEVALLQ